MKTKTRSVQEILRKRVDRQLLKGNFSPRFDLLSRGIENRLPKEHRILLYVWQNLRKSMEVLHTEDEDIPRCVCSVTETFYIGYEDDEGKLRESFLKRPPESREEAKLCIPAGGKHAKVAGLYFPQGRKFDLIYEEWILKYTRQGALLASLNVNRAGVGIQRKNLSPITAPTRIASCFSECFGDQFVAVIKEQIERGLSNGNGKRVSDKK